MQYAVARVGDPCTHGAVIQTGSPTRTVNGKAVARVGDTVNCPLHGQNPITGPATTVQLEGKSVARVGSTAQCGAVVTQGSPDTFTA